MKKVLGLDLGTTSIGWAMVNEADNEKEQSSIIKSGVRVIPLTTDEALNFEKGQSITTNQERTASRSARRNLQRYKLRRKVLVEELKKIGFLTEDSKLTEDGKNTTYETLELRAKAVNQKIEKDEFARILLAINKKRGYKSSRKAKNEDEGELIDGMGVAKTLNDRGLTPGQFALELLKDGKKSLPDYYRSDLQDELKKIWNFQKQYYSEIFTDDFFELLKGKGQKATSALFWKTYGFNTAENKNSRDQKKIQAYEWRAKALNEQLEKEEVAYVITEINNDINKSSGYLGEISDRSKELYFNNITVGQYLYNQIQENPHTRLKGQVFYRADYETEFDQIWAQQAKYYPELTDEAKEIIKDVVIFYQRPLKSQKNLISTCEFEGKVKEIVVDGKTKKVAIGPKVIPKSSPLFQEFKIWQILHNLRVTKNKGSELFEIDLDLKKDLFNELNIKTSMTDKEVLKFLLGKNIKGYELNYPKIEGNRTNHALFKAFERIIFLSGHGEYQFDKMNYTEVVEIVSEVFKALGINTNILNFDTNLSDKEIERQDYYQLWHLLYSFEGDNSETGDQKLIEKLIKKYGFSLEYSKVIASIVFDDDYGSLSKKAICKILPYLKEGHPFAKNGENAEIVSACTLAGYNHSHSLNKDERAKRELKEKLEILPKNSLRNPVVEKILNQMINVINATVDKYGKPDEVRIELARELKNSASERAEITKKINQSQRNHEEIKKILKNDFKLSYISKNDIIRYKLYKELEPRGFKTLYYDTYIAPDKLFSKEFDIEHIIPKSRAFDDSFSNKTLEKREVNIKKSGETAYDFVTNEYGNEELENYVQRVDDLFDTGIITKAKRNKLLMQSKDIPDGFIERDLRNSQYIAKKSKELLEEVFRTVNTTTGSVTAVLREDWQIVDVLKEINFPKYEKLGLTYTVENRDGKVIKKIKDWSKRNDHRHHAMDAITVAFTKYNHIQFLNYLNARKEEGHKKAGNIIAIQNKETYKDKNGKLRFNPPMPLNDFRAACKESLESILVSNKAKNKVVTPNKNKIKGYDKVQKILTPRGQLHNETVYGKIKQYITKEVKVGGSFDEIMIAKVAKQKYRLALLKRLKDFDNNPKKAFTGKNDLSKNPIYLDDKQSAKVPDKVKLVEIEEIYTIKKAITSELKLDKVIDIKVKKILEERLKAHAGNAKNAFSDLEKNPIWLNKSKGIAIKSVKITGVSNAESLHDQKDHFGKEILDKEQKTNPVDFVSTSNNHHVAIYRDKDGKLQEKVVSFFEAVARANQGLSIIDKEYKKDEGYEFLFTMKQNEFFVFPNEKIGFNLKEIDLFNPENYKKISPNLFRVQKIATKDYFFRHHLETLLENNNDLKDVTWKRLGINGINDIIKVRVNHLGEIVQVGEY